MLDRIVLERTRNQGAIHAGQARLVVVKDIRKTRPGNRGKPVIEVFIPRRGCQMVTRSQSELWARVSVSCRDQLLERYRHPRKKGAIGDAIAEECVEQGSE